MRSVLSKTITKAFISGTHLRARGHLLGTGQEAVERCCGRSMSHSALSRLGHTRRPGAMSGRQYVPLQKVTNHVTGQAETTHTIRRAQGKAGRAIELARGPIAPSLTPHTTRRRHRGVVLFIIEREGSD